MTDRGTKQRPLQIQVTEREPFFAYFNLMNKVDQRAEPAPQPGPLEGLLLGRGPGWPETLAVLLLPVPGWAESALGMGTGVWGRERRLAPLVTGPGDPGGVKMHTIYFWVLSKADGFGEEEGRACCVGPPCVLRGPGSAPQALCHGPERWPAWGPGEGASPRLPATNAIPEPRSVFPLRGPGAQRERASGAAVLVSCPHQPCTTRAFSLVPRPQDSGPSLTKGACTCG